MARVADARPRSPPALQSGASRAEKGRGAGRGFATLAAGRVVGSGACEFEGAWVPGGGGGGGHRRSGAMAYNMYQTQLSQAWAERVNKESAQQEMFWKNRAKKLREEDLQSVATRASAKTTTTEFLRSRMETLEQELAEERTRRLEVEKALEEYGKQQAAGAGAED